MTSQLIIVRQIDSGSPSGHDQVIPNGARSHQIKSKVAEVHDNLPAIQTITNIPIVIRLTVRTICILSDDMRRPVIG
jgi:hypothetical protein